MISIIIALALLSFIIDPTTLSTALQSMSSKYDVGKINGKSVSYTDFQEDIQTFTTIHELTSGSSAQSEEQQQQIRDAAWQNLIDKYLFVKQAKAAGLNVGEAEMLALTSDEMTSDVLKSNYAFLDQDGNYDPSILVDFVKSVDSDATGRLRTYWNFLQNSIYNQQFYSKYASLFNTSNFQNDLMLNKAIADNNNTTDVSFVMLPFGYTMTDTSVVVTNDEIKRYYDAHKEFYRQSASRDIEYVVFEVVPSEKDITDANEKISAVYDEFSTTDNMKSFLLKNSDRPYSEYWYKDGELNAVNADLNAFAFNAERNAPKVSGIIQNGNTFYAGRVMDAAMVPDSAYVKHILLQGENAAHLADSLLTVVKNRGNFSNLAAMYSVDQSSAADGELGNIGWMTQSYMIPGFESVIKEAEIGKPFILTTQYGTHVVLVSKKSKPVLKKQVAILEQSALAGRETYNEYYNKASRFAAIANGTLEGYRAAVDSMGVYSHVQNNVLESTSAYGAIDNAKELTRWIFEAKKGKASKIVTVNNNYFFIAALKGIHEEGYATVAEAAETIRPTLYMEKLGAKKAEEVAAKIQGLNSLEEIAEALGASVSTQTLSFGALQLQGVDPKFVGAASVAPMNQICGPVAGNIAVYVFEVTGRDTGSYYTEDDAKNFETQKNQYNSQMVMSVMQRAADVKDNRARFF
ncbi:MAG: SurA N-terminal domain-containing protein [Bacteroidales bacterium]|nr:SurA N-terminal domain-containing protein [Bacteroidales bacterium]